MATPDQLEARQSLYDTAMSELDKADILITRVKMYANSADTVNHGRPLRDAINLIEDAIYDLNKVQQFNIGQRSVKVVK